MFSKANFNCVYLIVGGNAIGHTLKFKKAIFDKTH